MTGRGRALRAAAGIAGPLAFIAAWSTLGARKAGYSPIEDPISRLAAHGAETRPLMTGGFLAFSAGVGLYSSALRAHMSKGAGWAAASTAVATIGVAALPLGGTTDTAHGVAASLAYSTLAALPLAGSLALASKGARRAALVSVATAATIAGTLAATALTEDHTGLLQRIGLTTGDAWIIASAVWILRQEAARSR